MVSKFYKQIAVNFARNKDIITFIFYSLVLLVLSPLLIKILNQPWNISNGTMRLIASYIWQVESSGIFLLIYLTLGLYSGFIILLCIDEKKRFQAIILFFIMLSIVYNIISGNIFSNVSWIGFIPWVLAGLIIGFIIGGGKRIFNGNNEFKIASNHVALLSTFIIIFTMYLYYFDVYRIDELVFNLVSFIKDMFVSFVYVFFFMGFMKYETKQPNIFVLGPAQSGKTLLLIGLYLKSLDVMKDCPINPSKALVNKVEEFLSQNDAWPSSTGGNETYSFDYKSGKLFPKTTAFSTIDYPGYYLKMVSKYFSERYNINKKSDDLENNDNDKIAPIVDKIIKSDILILIIDSEKYPDFNALGISDYVEILKSLNNKKHYLNVRIVFTKCDVFIDDFYNHKGELPNSIRYEDFKDYIISKFENNVSIQLLQSQTFNAPMYPIYYSTDVTDDNSGSISRTPLKDSFGNITVNTFGFNELIDDLT